MSTTEYKVHCPNCGTDNELATSVGGADNDGQGPMPQDANSVSIMICFTCSNVFALNEKGEPRNPTLKEFDEMMEDPRIIIGVAMVTLTQQRQRTKHALDTNETSRAGE